MHRGALPTGLFLEGDMAVDSRFWVKQMKIQVAHGVGHLSSCGGYSFSEKRVMQKFSVNASFCGKSIAAE